MDKIKKSHLEREKEKTEPWKSKPLKDSPNLQSEYAISTKEDIKFIALLNRLNYLIIIELKGNTTPLDSINKEQKDLTKAIAST